MAHRVRLVYPTNCLWVEKKISFFFFVKFQFSYTKFERKYENERFVSEKLERDWCVQSSSSSSASSCSVAASLECPFFYSFTHTHTHAFTWLKKEEGTPKKYRTARSTQMWCALSAIAPLSSLSLYLFLSVSVYEWVHPLLENRICLQIFVKGMKNRVTMCGCGCGCEYGCGCEWFALCSFCLFDTCVVSDCPYYVTHCVTDDPIEPAWQPGSVRERERVSAKK